MWSPQSKSIQIALTILALMILIAQYLILFFLRLESLEIPEFSQNPYQSVNVNKTIWQTSKLLVSSNRIPRFQSWWEMKDWDLKLVDDYGVDNLINSQSLDARVMDLLNRHKILKYDLYRYLAVDKYGGVYADSDVALLNSHYMDAALGRGCNVVIGIEADYRNKEIPDDTFLLDLQFCQWSFYSTARHPLFQRVVSEVVKRLGQNVNKPELDTKDILRITGPVAFTESIMDYFTNELKRDLYKELECGRDIQIGDICIQNINIFSPGQDHSCYELERGKDHFIHHHFDWSWRTDSGIKDGY